MPSKLTIVAGPPGGGKSGFVRDRLAEDPERIQIDYTALFAALAAQERDPDTRLYPMRAADDPKLEAASYLWYQAISVARIVSQPGYITTAKRAKIEELKGLADTDDVRIIDPGRDVAESRLRSMYGGELPVECKRALDGWYEVEEDDE